MFKHYFEELEEESLRDNFVVVVGEHVQSLFAPYDKTRSSFVHSNVLCDVFENSV